MTNAIITERIENKVFEEGWGDDCALPENQQLHL